VDPADAQALMVKLLPAVNAGPPVVVRDDVMDHGVGDFAHGDAASEAAADVHPLHREARFLRAARTPVNLDIGAVIARAWGDGASDDEALGTRVSAYGDGRHFANENNASVVVGR